MAGYPTSHTDRFDTLWRPTDLLTYSVASLRLKPREREKKGDDLCQVKSRHFRRCIHCDFSVDNTQGKKKGGKENESFYCSRYVEVSK